MFFIGAYGPAHGAKSRMVRLFQTGHLVRFSTETVIVIYGHRTDEKTANEIGGLVAMKIAAAKPAEITLIPEVEVHYAVCVFRLAKTRKRQYQFLPLTPPTGELFYLKNGDVMMAVDLSPDKERANELAYARRLELAQKMIDNSAVLGLSPPVTVNDFFSQLRRELQEAK